MTKEQALNILLQAVEIAQQKGAYTLQDAKNVIMAVEILISRPLEKDDTTESKDAN